MSDTFFSFNSHAGKAGPIVQDVKLIHVNGTLLSVKVCSKKGLSILIL